MRQAHEDSRIDWLRRSETGTQAKRQGLSKLSSRLERLPDGPPAAQNRTAANRHCQCVLSLMTSRARSDSVAEARPGRDCAHSAVWSKSWEDLVGVKPQP